MTRCGYVEWRWIPLRATFESTSVPSREPRTFEKIVLQAWLARESVAAERGNQGKEVRICVHGCKVENTGCFAQYLVCVIQKGLKLSTIYCSQRPCRLRPETKTLDRLQVGRRRSIGILSPTMLIEESLSRASGWALLLRSADMMKAFENAKRWQRNR